MLAQARTIAITLRVFFLTLLALVSAARSSAASPTPPPVSPLFASLLPQLRAHAEIPIQLPAIYPAYGSGEGHLYAFVDTVSTNAYSVTVTYDPSLTGVSSSMYGRVAVAVAKGSIDTSNAARSKSVTLSNGAKALWIVPRCGASCSPTLITWDEGGYRFMISSKFAPTVQAYIDMANSMTTY